MIRLGLCLAAFAPRGLAGALAVAAELGVDEVDLPADSTFGFLSDAAAETVKASGLRVGCVSNSRDCQLVLGPHGPQTDPVLAGTPEEKREHGLAAARAAIELAADLGAPYARLMLGVPDLSRWLSWWGSTAGWQDNVAAWAEAAAPLYAYARSHEVELLVEPHPKQTAYDPASARSVLASVPGVKLCADVANLAAVGHDPVAVVRGWGTELAAVHAKDLQVWCGAGDPVGAGWSRYGPGPAIRFRALGAGELPWPAVVAALLDEGFDGTVYVEHEDTLLPAAQGARTSLAVLRSLLPEAEPEGRTW